MKFQQVFGVFCYLVVCQIASADEEVIDFFVSEEDKQLILDLHNQFRRRVASGEEWRGSPGPQPAATYMPDLVWDDEAANAAWKWAQNLDFSHDPKLEELGAGQNLALSYNSEQFTKPNWADDAINLWYSEVENMDCRTVESLEGFDDANGGFIGHYTQMVWAGTTGVGCSAISYFDDLQYNMLYVCNYSPAGNVLGQPVYEIDYSSSSCPF